MTPSLLLALALLAPQHHDRDVDWLAVWDGDSYRVAARGRPVVRHSVVLPAITTSAIVARAIPVGDVVRLRVGHVPGGRLTRLKVRRVEHAPDEQVLNLTEPALAGPPRLPARATGLRGQDVLPHLARRDGNAVAAGSLIPPADLPEGSSLVLIRRNGLAVAADATPELLLNFGGRGSGSPLDQAFYARVTPVPLGHAETILDMQGGELLARDEHGFVYVDVPAPRASGGERTWTLVATFDFGPDPDPIAPAPTAAAVEAGSFADVAVERGVDFVHFEGPDEQLDIRPTMGPGAAWGDVDGDGWVDLYLVQGGGRAGSDVPPNRLFRNDGEGGFEEVERAGGADDRGAGMGALFFDADGDGDLDLYVANYGADVFYLNDGTGSFTNASESAGVGGDLWSAGVAAADYDGDGDLDLYVTSYLDYDESKMPAPEDLGRYRREDPIAMLPFAFPGQRNAFLRNDTWQRDAETGELAQGPVRFTDVAAELGLLDAEGRGMQPVFWDFDRDGDMDLYVANDVSYNVLWRNEGDGTFRDVSFSTGMDDPRGGMGVAIGDVEGDGDEDLFLTNWQLETNGLYLNNLVSHRSRKSRVATFRDGIVESGLGPAAIGVTSWGTELFDADDDGDLDLFVANGYTSPDYESTGICVGQPNQYFENAGGGRFVDESAEAGAAVLEPLPSRGVAACDYDRDGFVDLLVTANNQRAQLLHNEVASAQALRGSLRGESGSGAEGVGSEGTGLVQDNAWLGVRLDGAGPNTKGIGAEVTVRAGEREWRRGLRAGGSYLCGNAPELHFGLGDVERVDEVVVRWPSGRESSHAVAELNTFVTLREPR